MKKSVGIIPYKEVNRQLLFFVGHPGGCRDNYWALLKGGTEGDESDLDTALREFREESGVDLTAYKDAMVYLGQVKQNPKKNVGAFSVKVEDINPAECHSNLCPNGVTPEIDQYRWMSWEELKPLTHKQHIIFYEKILNGDN